MASRRTDKGSDKLRWEDAISSDKKVTIIGRVPRGYKGIYTPKLSCIVPKGHRTP